MSRPQREEQRVKFELSEAEAIVLFEWLANYDGKPPFDEQLANARNAVRGDE